MFFNQNLRSCDPVRMIIPITKIYIFTSLFLIIYSPFTNGTTSDVFSIGLRLVGVLLIFSVFYGIYSAFYFFNDRNLKKYHIPIIGICSAIISGILVSGYESLVNIDAVISFSNVLENSTKILMILALVVVFFLVRSTSVTTQSNVANGNLVLNSKNKRETLHLKEEEVHLVSSHENYIKVFFTKDNKLQSALLRNTITNATKQIKNKDLMRCHRKHIVNLSKVYSISSRNQRLYLRVDEIEEPIIVSKPYVKAVHRRLINSKTTDKLS